MTSRDSISTPPAEAPEPAEPAVASLGRTPAASRFSADMSKHAYFGTADGSDHGLG